MVSKVKVNAIWTQLKWFSTWIASINQSSSNMANWSTLFWLLIWHSIGSWVSTIRKTWLLSAHRFQYSFQFDFFSQRSRCGQIRVLSMKVAVILLCKGSIEDKYICKCSYFVAICCINPIKSKLIHIKTCTIWLPIKKAIATRANSAFSCTRWSWSRSIWAKWPLLVARTLSPQCAVASNTPTIRAKSTCKTFSNGSSWSRSPSFGCPCCIDSLWPRRQDMTPSAPFAKSIPLSAFDIARWSTSTLTFAKRASFRVER